MPKRFSQNPLITTRDITPSRPDFIVECVMNPGAFQFDNKTWLLLRVAERPPQKEKIVSLPILNKDGRIQILEFDIHDPKLDTSDPRKYTYNGEMYLSTISHLRLVCSEDGIRFMEPDYLPTKIFGQGPLETYGIEDCRVSRIGDIYYLTYTQVSKNGVGVGMIQTSDWKSLSRKGMILPPHNKDCALFEEKIGGYYYCLHRPSGIGLGGNFIWISSSSDLLHWGNHQCILHTRPGMWDSDRIGAGAAPIKTPKGWLIIYHGANQHDRYCLGVALLDINDPSKVLYRANDPIFKPTTNYERKGFYGNVVFTNGHIVNGNEIVMYYGASDEVICGATFTIEEILA